MSWQAYIDSLLNSKKIQKAAIMGQDGSTWAVSAGFAVSAQEFQSLKGAFADPSNIRANGLHVAGVRYIALGCTDKSIYGKKGGAGVILCKTKQAILVCVYPDSVQPGDATNTVEKLADYLVGLQY